MRLLIIFILIGITSALPAQNRRMQFKGKVLDRVTNLAVPDVNIGIIDSRRGTSTNQKGEFSMILYNLPVFLVISHLGYETQRIWIDDVSTSITILLNPGANLLQEVEIKANNNPLPFFKDHQYSVLDYEIDSSLVYMLIYKFRLANAELFCKNVSGDTLARSGILPFKPVGLFRDCMGNIHVLSADSSYQVKRDQDRLFLWFPVDINRFRSVLQNCVASTNELLYFRKESPDRQSVDFYTIDRKNSSKRSLSTLRNEENLKILRRNSQDYWFLMMDSIPSPREYMAQWLWVKKILYKPNTSTLHRINDLMCVFNTTDYTLALYTLKGTFTSKLKMPVEKIKDGKWTTEIFIDDIESKAYTSFYKSGLFTIYRIDLNTGELKRKLVTTHDFPVKIKVNGGYLFYLYQVKGSGDNRHLFRQKL